MKGKIGVDVGGELVGDLLLKGIDEEDQEDPMRRLVDTEHLEVRIANEHDIDEDQAPFAPDGCDGFYISNPNLGIFIREVFAINGLAINIDRCSVTFLADQGRHGGFISGFGVKRRYVLLRW